MSDGVDALASVCPFCFYRATHVGSMVGGTAPPVPGDFSLCLGCGELSVFAAIGGVRRPTAAEAAEFAADPEMIAAKQAWREMVAAHGRPMGGYSHRRGNA